MAPQPQLIPAPNDAEAGGHGAEEFEFRCLFSRIQQARLDHLVTAETAA
ncbi:MAG: hypothetical protein JNN17_17110 [Verrucomicrobiaceae bacterium]|nr:hypothetical protein [Verrucomicrobiaceae bacterium]